MRKAISFFFLVLIAVALTGCSFKKQAAALQVNSVPSASVFINGKLVGKTPYIDRNMNPGEITLKLIPESTASALSSWEGKIKLVGGILSVVSREFAELEDNSSGDILTLEPIRDKKSASLAVVTSPDGAAVKLDGENRGFSPLVLDKINEGERQIVLSLPGYKERILQARAVNGFKLIVNSKLAKEGGEPTVTPTPESPTPTKKATSKLTITPTVTPKVSPTPTVKLTPRPTMPLTGAYVLIKETSTGWLRVRSGAGQSYEEIAKVYPSEKYPFIEEKSGWYKILYAEGKEGWISGQYAQKSEE